MGTNKFDEIQCQVLKVSGADKIELAVDVTEKQIDTKLDATAIAKVTAAPTGYSVLTLTDGSGFAVGGDITGDGDNANDGVGTIAAKNGSDICLVDDTSGSWVATNGVDDANPYSADATTIASVDEAVTVMITMQDKDGNTITGVQNVLVWLSDSATGVGEPSTMAVDWFTVLPGSGAVLKEHTADNTIMCQTATDGTLTLFMSEATPGASSVGYICVANPISGVVTTLAIAQVDFS